MARKSNFADSVINGTYEDDRKKNIQQPIQETQPTINNSFANSVINGTYDSNKSKNTVKPTIEVSKPTIVSNEPKTNNNLITSFSFSPNDEITPQMRENYRLAKEKNDRELKEYKEKEDSGGYHFGDFTKGLLNVGGDLVKGAVDLGGKAVGTVVDVGGNLLHGGLQALEGGADALQYLGADINDFLGRNKEAELLRQNARFNSVGALFGENKPQENIVQQNVLEALDRNSFAPEIIDDISSGVGGVAMNAALSYLTGGGNLSTAATNASIFTTSYGDAMSKALNNGASVNDARLTALIDATASTVAENAFDSKFGMKTTGFLGKALNGKIGNAFNNIVKTDKGKALFGILKSAVEEGSEEVIEPMISNFSQSLAHDLISSYDYNGDKYSSNPIEEFFKPLTQQETLEKFVMAALTSAVYNTGANALSNAITSNNATQEIVIPQNQTETPQNQTNQENNINSQPTREQLQIDLNGGNNEVIQNKVDLGLKEAPEVKAVNKVLQKLQGNKEEYIGIDKRGISREVQDQFNDNTQYLNDTLNKLAKKETNNIPETKSEDVLKVNKQELTGKEGEQYFKDNGVDDRVAKILSEKPKEQKENLKDKLSQVGGAAYRLLVSRGGEVEKIAKVTGRQDVKYKSDRAMRARSEAQQHIGSGQTDLGGKLYKNFVNKNKESINMSLNDIRQDAKTSGIPESTLNQYLADWLNVDRFREGKPVFGSSYTSEMSMENIAKLDKQYPELNRVASNVWTYEQNELKNLYDSGLITEKLYNKLKENKHYVRIQRNIENNSNNGPVIDKNGRITVNQTIQKATGGNQDILPIMEGIADYTTKMLQNERTNEFARELAKAIGVSSTGEQIIDNEESFGVDPEFVKQNDNGTYTLTYFNKGVATQVPINKAIYDAFVKNKAIASMENSELFKAITYTPKKLSSMFRNLTTNYNPMFMATNMLKDIGDAPFNSKYTKEFLKIYTSQETLKEVATNGVYNQLYRRLGGQDDSYFTEGEFIDKKGETKNKALKAVTTPGRLLKNAISKGNEVIETMPRLTEFIATIKANGYEVNQDGELILKDSKKAKGKTADQVLDEALYNAAEVTTNFKRGGDLAKSLNRNGVTFFNASIQGFDKQVRNFKDAFTSGDKKAIVKVLTKALIFGIAPTMLNDAMYSDDDEYKELQDYIKDNYYVFKVGNTWIRIPKGRAMSVIGSASRRTKDYASGESDAFSGFVNFAAGQVAPNNPFENNIIAPFLAVKNNKSWSGNKIVSQTMEKRPEAEQYNEKTDEFSKWLGGVLNVSPMKINYLIDQYTGGIGDVVLPMITPKSTGTTDNALLQPLVSKFTFDPAYSSKSVSNFYDAMTKLEKNKYSVKANEIDKLKYSYIYSQNQKMSELKKEQSKIQSDNSLSNKDKYEKAREVQLEINELAKKSLDALNNIENNKYYAIVGDNTYYLDDNGDGTQSFKKDAYADSHKKTADKKGMALYDYYKEKYEERKEKNNK